MWEAGRPGPVRPPARGIRFVLDAEGAEAALEGKDEAANPYKPGTMESIGWLAGWARARLALIEAGKAR